MTAISATWEPLIAISRITRMDVPEAGNSCATQFLISTSADVGGKNQFFQIALQTCEQTCEHLRFSEVYGKMLQSRPGGEIGRRASLRCWWAQALAGSNPVPGICKYVSI